MQILLGGWSTHHQRFGQLGFLLIQKVPTHNLSTSKYSYLLPLEYSELVWELGLILEQILEWEPRGSNDGRLGSIIYNPENIAIGGTARYLYVPLNQPKFTHYRSVIEKSRLYKHLSCVFSIILFRWSHREVYFRFFWVLSRCLIFEINL